MISASLKILMPAFWGMASGPFFSMFRPQNFSQVVLKLYLLWYRIFLPHQPLYDDQCVLCMSVFLSFFLNLHLPPIVVHVQASVHAMLIEYRVTDVNGFDTSKINKYNWAPHYQVQVSPFFILKTSMDTLHNCKIRMYSNILPWLDP